MKNNITIICKPTHNCNMDCEYCYDKKEKQLVKNNKMPLELLEHLIRISLKSFKNIVWIWHGGEATLMGKDFFVKANEIFNKYKTDEHDINFYMQSNGKNFDETRKWIDELNIKPGYSYDIINDNEYRKDKYNLLDKLDKDDGVISVVSEPYADLITPFIKYQNKGITFNKLFFQKDIDNVDGYVDSFIKLFDYILWNKKTKIERNLRDYIKMICLSKEVYCNMKQCLGSMISVNPDGLLMICDTFGVEDNKYNMGNVIDYKELSDCFTSNGFINAIKDDFTFRRNNCEKCEVNMFCKNICKNSRINNFGERDLSYANKQECEFRIKLLNHIFEVLFNLSKKDLQNINEEIYTLLLENKFIFKFIIDELEE